MSRDMRALVSYDDITLPYHSENTPKSQPSKPPPAKKRKWNKNNNNSRGRNHDDTRSTASFPQGHLHAHNAGEISTSVSSAMAIGSESVDVEDEGHELTHDEIWDDSALIDAWNAATEEYEAYNGPDKGWKKEPIHKSPLWYNVPKTTTKDAPSTSNGQVSLPTPAPEEENSRPFDFNTFTPSHDPSLDMPVPALGADSVPQFLSDAPGPMVSQDEAFTRALGAMYWSGYWTAMYHAQRRNAQGQTAHKEAQQGEEESYGEDDGEDNGEDEEEVEDENEDEDDAFVSTQR